MRAGKLLAASSGVWFLFSNSVFAQAGPPLMTNDTGTPGPGKWEINLAAIGTHGGTERSWSVPDADVNFGIGERIQLSVHVPWMRTSLNGRSLSGLGAIEYAVRWRFIDQEQAGLDLAIQPHVVMPGSAKAIRDGLSPARREYVLPIQAVRHGPVATLGVEIARHWVEREGGAIQFGMFAARDCGGLECLAEISTTHDFGASTQTFIGIGVRRSVSNHVKLMGAIDHQINGPSDMRLDTTYLGIQITP